MVKAEIYRAICASATAHQSQIRQARQRCCVPQVHGSRPGVGAGRRAAADSRQTDSLQADSQQIDSLQNDLQQADATTLADDRTGAGLVGSVEFPLCACARAFPLVLSALQTVLATRRNPAQDRFRLETQPARPNDLSRLVIVHRNVGKNGLLEAALPHQSDSIRSGRQFVERCCELDWRPRP